MLAVVKRWYLFFSGLKCISSGYQFALMSPTEILAKQHYVNFKNLHWAQISNVAY